MNRFIILFFISVLALFSCNGGTNDTNDSTIPLEDIAKKPKEIKKELVVISTSPKEDYPEIFLDNDVPVMPQTEVAGVGNTMITKDSGASFKMNTMKTIPEIVAFYTEKLTAKGWKSKDINLYKGASKAIAFEKENTTMQLMIIDDIQQDYRKIMLILTQSDL